MPNQAFPPVPPTPREYWEDNDWANTHIAEIAAAYPNLWVAVVDKQVVASGKIISDVRKAAETKTGKTHFPVVFAERGYTCLHGSISIFKPGLIWSFYRKAFIFD
ncbi:hypothetical protein HUU05_13955 [candidate division KSB1 bacterium]|nr:hypothetical protein [candidate division KSB1 bacterium]